MLKNKLKPKINIRDYPDEVKSDKWRNLYIDTDGKSHPGSDIWPSEEKAAEVAKELIASLTPFSCRFFESTGCYLALVKGNVIEKPGVTACVYSYNLQMPVKD